jgi:hypothetical protein
MTMEHPFPEQPIKSGHKAAKALRREMRKKVSHFDEDQKELFKQAIQTNKELKLKLIKARAIHSVLVIGIIASWIAAAAVTLLIIGGYHGY